MNMFQEMYLDYVNNFITVARFAEYYHITNEQALYVISEGKRVHEEGLI